MDYHFTKRVHDEFDNAKARVVEALKEEGFGC